MKNPHRSFKRFQKKTKRGSQGYPIATIALYGPDNKKATKVTVGIIKTEGGDADIMKRWFSEEADIDIRKNGEIGEEITDFIQSQDVKSVVMTDGLMGCPHEEVVDYPEGESCPMCPYWQNRDRFTGEIIH
jgi:hypothetical protein